MKKEYPFRDTLFLCINYYHKKQLGGPDGELGASMRYLTQRYSMPYDKVKGLLTDIGIEDLFCTFRKVFMFSPLERGFASLYSPLSFFIPKEPRV